MWAIALIAMLFVRIKAQEDSVVPSDGFKCYYCGITDSCAMPYDESEGKFINCDKSCMKFDGLATDGKRVVVRNCGYFTANECVEEAIFEDETTIGTICHCLEDTCNSGRKITINALSVYIALLIIKLS